MFCACAEDSKWRPAARVCLIRPIMDEDFNPSLHILDQSERELCGNEVYLVLLHRVSLAGRRKMKVERKKEEKNLKKIGQIGLFDQLWND